MRDQMISRQVLPGTAEYTFLRQLLLAFPFPYGVRNGDVPVTELLESIGNESVLKRTVSRSRDQLGEFVKNLFPDCFDV
jgi:hypothetical protein